MLRHALPLAGIFLFLISTGCKRTTPSEQVLEKDTTFDVLTLNREGVIDYEIKTVKVVGVDPRNRRKIISEVHIKYPELKYANNQLKEEVRVYVNNFVGNLLKDNMNAEDTARAKTIKTAAQAFVNSCKSNILELRKEDPDFDQVWYCDVLGNVEMQSDRFFTLRFKYNTFTGGAHGEYGEDFSTFSITSGKRLTWEDILSDRDKFVKLAENRFKQVNGINVNSKLSEDEGFFFENNRFYLSDNFGLTSDGILVYYQPYQVAPYSFGATTLLFKYFEVINYLKPSLFGEPM